MTNARVHLFIDNSNIFISAQDEAQKLEGRLARLQMRLYFENLFKLALNGRILGNACVVGSIPPEQKSVWDRLEVTTGVRPELYERGKLSGAEQGLDQCIQVHMLRAISDHKDPQIAVLMTGDGAGYDDGVGFHADLERMHAAGWGIEVISWKNHCKRALRDWAVRSGVFVALDDYYEAVTFLEGGRVVRPIDLTRRRMSSSRSNPAMAAEERMRLEYETEIHRLRNDLSAALRQHAAKVAAKVKYDRRYARGAR